MKRTTIQQKKIRKILPPFPCKSLGIRILALQRKRRRTEKKEKEKKTKNKLKTKLKMKIISGTKGNNEQRKKENKGTRETNLNSRKPKTAAAQIQIL